MSRYIDAERFDVFDAVKPEQYDTEAFMAGMEVVLDAIKDAPSIEPTPRMYQMLPESKIIQEPKQGEWVEIWENEMSTKAKCSECGRISARPLGHFCRWCGARMKGAK